MKTYTIAVTIVALLAVGIVLGANVQPILTGAGYVVFPENATHASIHAASGSLVLDSGGNTAIRFRTNSTSRWDILGTGHLVAVTDNSFDIGADGATRPRSLYVGTLGKFGAPCNTAGCAVTTNATQTLTNKTIDYLANTITNLPAGGYTAFTTPAIAVNTVYQNTSGGAQYIQVPASVLGVGSTALAYCDSANPPTTIVSMFSDVNGVTNQYGTLSFVVLNNYYWKIATGTNLYDGNARVWR